MPGTRSCGGRPFAARSTRRKVILHSNLGPLHFLSADGALKSPILLAKPHEGCNALLHLKIGERLLQGENL